MDDTTITSPDHDCLFAIASGQYGYFTSLQAADCGFGSALLAHHVKHGRYIRISRGLYRLKAYPSSPREEVVAAWLGIGKDVAVVSHDSALDLFGLSDVIPDAVHLTVPRWKRNLRSMPGVKLHTTVRPLERSDLTYREGIKVTSAARTIVDLADAGTGPEQIELAIRQAIRRGLTTRKRLEQTADSRSLRVINLIGNALKETSNEI